MEDVDYVPVESHIMVMTWLDWLILGGAFVGAIYFVFVHIASDLPDDFLTKVSKKNQAEKEARRGRIRDNG